MLYDAIETYLTSKGLLTGWKLYVDGFREKHDAAINIQEYGNYNGPKGITSNTRQIQVMVRSKDIIGAYNHAQSLCIAFEATDEEDRIQLTEDRWATFFVRETPVKFKEDEAGRTYYLFNMACTTSKY